MGTTEKELTETLQREAERPQSGSKMEAYEKALLHWKDLVRRGIAKERGYNLLTIDSPDYMNGGGFNKSQLGQEDEFIPLIFPIHLAQPVDGY
jgi:hypothetical protein